MMDMGFEDFIKITREGIKKGEIKIVNPDGAQAELSDYDLMIMFAIGKIGERYGDPLTIKLDDLCDEIYHEVMKMGPYAEYLWELPNAE